MNSKKLLRHSLRQARRSLTQAQQQRAALHLSQRLLRSHWFKRSRSVGFYWPADGEISPLPLMRAALRMGKVAFLPTIKGDSLVFKRYASGDRLYKNRFGIPEPSRGQPTFTVDKLDLVLVPLVGFDSRGNRLGMGAGFYDRCFQYVRTRPWRIGVAHELQKLAEIPQDPWDKPMHAVLTDRHSYTRQKKRDQKK